MSQITYFLPQLQQVNVICSDSKECNMFEYGNFRKVVDFYDEHKDVSQFEKMVLDILFEKEKQIALIVLQGIKSELDKNIAIYNENILIFKDIDPDGIRNDAVHLIV